MKEVMNSMSSGILHTRFRVVSSCRISPLTRQRSVMSWGLAIVSLETTAGPRGPNESKHFVRTGGRKWLVSFRLKSLKSV
jgi:hypothetical protein